MADFVNIPLGYNIPSQIPLDVKLHVQSESVLRDLGAFNFKVYNYYKGLIVYCANEGTRYEWTEVTPFNDGTGLLPGNYKYPSNIIAYSINYSNKYYNFFKYSNDGSSTKLVAGSNVTISGNGTPTTPYIITGSASSASTTLVGGINTTVTGNGTSATPFKVNVEFPTITPPNGAETKIIEGSNIRVLGNGTITTPYTISAPRLDDATSTAKGVIQLAGDLGGTANAPTVPALASKVNNTGNQVLPLGLTLNYIVKAGGTASQFLKADGTVDSNSYALIIPHLEYNNTDFTIWNNGKGNGFTNTTFGQYSLTSNTSGSSNTANGIYSLEKNTIGSANTAYGATSLKDNVSGANNVAVGNSSLTSNLSGSQNTSIGTLSLMSNTTASNNTAIGIESLSRNTIGGQNVAIGSNAGTYVGISSVPITTCYQSIFLGHNASSGQNNSINEIVIGYNAVGLGTSTVTLGNETITTTRLRGNVRGGAFIKDGGTPTQRLMADGSVKLEQEQTVITANYTLSNVDNDKIIFVNNGATPITITVPLGLMNGFECGFIQIGTADVDFVSISGSSVVSPNGLKIKGQNYNAFISKYNVTGAYYLLGSLKV